MEFLTQGENLERFYNQMQVINIVHVDSVHSIRGFVLCTAKHDSSSFVGGRDLYDYPNVQYNNTLHVV